MAILYTEPFVMVINMLKNILSNLLVDNLFIKNFNKSNMLGVGIFKYEPMKHLCNKVDHW